jgi:hypothetical protein
MLASPTGPDRAALSLAKGSAAPNRQAGSYSRFPDGGMMPLRSDDFKFFDGRRKGIGHGDIPG